MVVAGASEFRLHCPGEVAPILAIVGFSRIIVIPIIIGITVIRVAIKRVTEPKEEAIVKEVTVTEKMVSVVKVVSVVVKMAPIVVKREIMRARMESPRGMESSRRMAPPSLPYHEPKWFVPRTVMRPQGLLSSAAQ